MKLKLTHEIIRAHLFCGSFRPMNKTDYDAYNGADEGSLIADIMLSGYTYSVIFSPVTGAAQINVFDETTNELYAWEMDLNTGINVKLS
jgi:hypothetical protein